MQFYIITHPATVPNEADIISYLLSNELATVHLRKPDSSVDNVRKLLKAIPASLHNKIVVHNHLELSNEFGIKGLHFNRHTQHLIKNYESFPGSKSISTHGLNEITDLPSVFDYYFLSPIFASTSKPGYGGNSFLMKDILKFAKQNPDRKLVALSGITHKNIYKVKQAGFYGAAILGGFWDFCSISEKMDDISVFFHQMNSVLL